MSLRPDDIAAADYTVALKPEVGYESKLYLSPLPALEVGTLLVRAASSGVYTPNPAENLALAAAPLELLAVMNREINDAGDNIVVTVVGTTSADAPCTWTGTIKPPAYSGVSAKIFPRGWAAELIPSVADAACKTILSVSISCHVKAKNVSIKIVGIPLLTSFSLVGCKAKLDYDPKVAEALSIRCGRDPSAFTKPGDYKEGMMSVSAKVINRAEGLARFNGVQCTGWIKTTKEDKLVTDHTFFTDLTLTAKNSGSESTDPTTLEAEGKFAIDAMVVAQ